jgi:FAD/FMN-containing dehydrogenase/Fe-S oxidoreductase
MDELNADVLADLRRAITGEVKSDPVTRVLYSTDASIHSIPPLGVVFPRHQDELSAIVSIADKYRIPLIPRGSGSSLAGQAIGSGLVIDCSRYLTKLVKINPDERTVTVEPGLVLDDLNREARKHNLRFGPDPASSERATLGGCIGNNATGAHSILYGMTADHILAAEVVLADGSNASFSSLPISQAQEIVKGNSDSNNSRIVEHIYESAIHIRDKFQEDIRSSWPRTWRRVSGYNLNYLLPWSPNAPDQWDKSEYPYPPVLPETLNLAQLLAGSEGTLAIIRNATLRLVPVKRYTLISVLSFSSIIEACEVTPSILELSPSAVELIPQSLIRLARSVPAYANQLSFVRGDPPALLAVEFSGDDPLLLADLVSQLNQSKAWANEPFIAQSAMQQKQVWDVRNVGLGILMSRPGDDKPISFIEDMSVPVEKLGAFVKDMEIILTHYGTQADYYGHASAGCLHIRPLLNLKSSQGRVDLRSIAQEAAELVIGLGGAVSSEHGDGITRGEWIAKAYSANVLQAFRMIKQAADPHGILNPGKIVDPPKMDSHLRYDEQYHPSGWTPVMSFNSPKPEAARLVQAIEQCNGVGVCRKSEGVMCPSFQATKDEMFSTRGRANLLRAMISDGLPAQAAEKAVLDTLELCLACKGCKAECPSAVDMAKLKYEFYQHYYSSPHHHHPARDYLFGYIASIAKLGHLVPPMANFFITSSYLAGVREKMIGISKYRKLPRLSSNSLRDLAKPYLMAASKPDCLILSDAFNEYFYPHTGLDAIRVLSAIGCQVKLLSTIGSGRTHISKGFLKHARRQAKKVVDEINAIDPAGELPVIGIEPSEIYTLRDEYRDLLAGDDRVEKISKRAFMVDEYLIRPDGNGDLYLNKLLPFLTSKQIRTNVLIHGHCYQKAQPPAIDGYPSGVAATARMLEMVGYTVTTIKDGCCGMAGAFGYESGHYSLSTQIGELALFPAVRESRDATIAASGISCKAQIEDGTDRDVYHPISLVARLME